MGTHRSVTKDGSVHQEKERLVCDLCGRQEVFVILVVDALPGEVMVKVKGAESIDVSKGVRNQRGLDWVKVRKG